MIQVDGNLLPQDRVSNLGSQLDDLQALLNSLGLKYNIKKDAVRNTVSSNHAGEKERNRRREKDIKEEGKKEEQRDTSLETCSCNMDIGLN